KLILAPGQGTRLTGASKADRVWPSGMLDFDATPLSEAIGRANRYSRRKMRLADPGLAGLRVTGAFRIGDPVGLARSLAAAFDLRLEETADGHLSLGRKP
ncbi:MAG: hypothetical protein AVDCRST_MAG91-3791, partial [uncultured Sphingomonadaceae bacterium]